MVQAHLSLPKYLLMQFAWLFLSDLHTATNTWIHALCSFIVVDTVSGREIAIMSSKLCCADQLADGPRIALNNFEPLILRAAKILCHL